MTEYSFWKFTAYNEEAYYGHGSEEAASGYMDKINNSRDVNWVEKEEYTPVDSDDSQRMEQIAFQLDELSQAAIALIQIEGDIKEGRDKEDGYYTFAYVENMTEEGGEEQEAVFFDDDIDALAWSPESQGYVVVDAEELRDRIGN
jgi:hypothetical protein